MLRNVDVSCSQTTNFKDRGETKFGIITHKI